MKNINLQMLSTYSERECLCLIKQAQKKNNLDNGGNTSLMLAVENNYYEIAKLLIEIGIDIDAINNNG